jgi:phospholipase/lecithinase/hemolysin
VLLALTNTFNEEMRVPLVNDGRMIGLIDADAIVRNMVASPGAFGLGNITQPACNVALPDCTTATLVSGANASAYLWADLHQPSVRAHLQIGFTADTRARNNPF